MLRELDIILFGATGFTGKQAIPLLHQFTKNLRLLWGVAGRNEQKLDELLRLNEKQEGIHLSNVPKIVASIQDENSLKSMARRTKIIINCCGPYRFLGEPVVKACVEEGTHYIDVTGEPEFMEKMQLKYHQQAKEKQIYIISACGFDSVPSDLGVIFLQQNFKGTLNSVVSYLHIWEDDDSIQGSSGNYATWESAIHGLANAKELGEIRKKLFRKRSPDFKPTLVTKFKPHKSKIVKGWVLPFLGADRSVMKRSQNYFYELDSKRPIQIGTYFVIESALNVLKMELLVPIFVLLTKSEYGRNLLLQYPELFTAGIFSRHQSPSIEKLEKTNFCLTLYGEGWKETLPNPEDQFSTQPNKIIQARITGKNPAYRSACICAVLSAITVITETDNMPKDGGVYPPGYAFSKTSLIEKLNDNGIKFEIDYVKDLLASKM